ncbi:unnamed protein product, partial [Urochloa humidicola]
VEQVAAELKELTLVRPVARKRNRAELMAQLKEIKAELKKIKAERSLPGAKVTDEIEELRIALAPFVREASLVEAARPTAYKKKRGRLTLKVRPNSQGDPCCAAAPPPELLVHE